MKSTNWHAKFFHSFRRRTTLDHAIQTSDQREAQRESSRVEDAVDQVRAVERCTAIALDLLDRAASARPESDRIVQDAHVGGDRRAPERLNMRELRLLGIALSRHCLINQDDTFVTSELQSIAHEWSSYSLYGVEEQAALRLVERLAAQGNPEALDIKATMVALRLNGKYSDRP